jgi:hypothetical integral membrane protein (TIGR02206 family)
MNSQLNFLNEEGCKPLKKMLFFDIAQLYAVGLSALFAIGVYILLSLCGMPKRAAILKILCSINFAFLILRILNHKYVLKNFDAAQQLPFHVCGFSVILCLAAVFSGSEAITDIAFGLAPIGALMALAFPEANAAKYPRIKFRAIEYYYSHTNLFITPVFACKFLGFTPSVSYFPKFLICLGSMLVIAWAANRDTGGNYMYLSRAPSSAPLEYVERRFGRGAYRFALLIALASFYGIMHAIAFLALRGRQ